MTEWGPNTQVEGLEWFPVNQGARIINAAAKAAAMKIRVTAVDTIDTIYVYLPEDLRRGTTNGEWVLEIFEEGSEVPGAVSTATYRANAVDTNVNSSWVNDAAAVLATGNVVAAISETSLDATTYTQYRGTYQDKDGLFLEFNTNSASGSPDGAGVWAANRRVVGGRLRVTANRSEASGRVQFYFRPLGGGNFAIGEINVDTELREFTIPWPEVDPIDSRPWGLQEIRDFDSASSIRIKPLGIGKHKPLRIYQLALELDYVDENRVAIAMPFDSFVDGVGWTAFTLLDPNTGTGGSTPWTPTVDTTYTLMLRRLPRWRNLGSSTDLEGGVMEGGQVAWGYLEENVDTAALMKRDPWLPDGFMASYAPTLNADGTVAEMGEAGVRAYGVVFYDGAALEEWGEPYDELLTDDVPLATSYVRLGDAATSDDHALLRFLFADNPDNAVDSPDMTVWVERASDNVDVSSVETITYEEIRAQPVLGQVTDSNDVTYDVRLIEIEFATGATLVSGTDYQVRFDTADADDADDTHNLVMVFHGDVTFGAPSYDGTNSHGFTTSTDAPLTLSILPDEPTNFAVAVASQTLITDSQALTPDWLIGSMEYAAISWTATSLSSDFVAYEIQRSHDSGTTWESIFWITDEAVIGAQDYEGRRNVEASYRMRVWAAWHVGSSWTDVESVTCEMTQCALLFVTNEDPDINQGYNDIGGERTYTFLSADERTTRTLVGRNYQIVTAPLEYRGDQFEVTLASWAGSVPADTGRDHFDRLEQLNGAATSYVCVLDETGRRWYADVAVSEGTRQGTKVHTAQARVIEITDTPSLVGVG